MRRLGWIIGGLVIMALWASGAGAQDGRQMYQGMRHNWRDIRQDRQDMRRDWRDIQRDPSRSWQERRGGNYEAYARHRAALRRERVQLHTDRPAFWHDWRPMHRYPYNCW